MARQAIPLRTTLARFAAAIGNFAGSALGGRAKLIFACLAALLCAVNGLNVVNSYVGRNFMTAITERNSAGFVRQALLYLCVFAASTVVAVFARFAEERLALLWREFVTGRAIKLYLSRGTYDRLSASGELTHPDQRIAEDLRAFTVTTLSFVLMGFNSSLTILAFSGVLWSISPLLFGVAIAYAACGTFFTFILGRPLVALNYNQLDKEASFRSGLIHVREHAESIRLSHREDLHRQRLLERLGDLIGNFRTITGINRNVGFFTTGYNWLIQIIPALVIAPSFIRGEIEFGVVTQSAMAFATLVAAFSLIVTQFQSLSNFAAVIARLNVLMEAMEHSRAGAQTPIAVVEAGEDVAYEHLTLRSSPDDEILLKNLSIKFPARSRILLTGSNLAARLALIRATAGIGVPGEGTIERPDADGLLFLPERPYLPPGTLRQVLVPDPTREPVADQRILDLLGALDLRHLPDQAGGLDAERDWGTVLSLREQQLLAVAAVLLAAPRLAFLDRIDTSLTPDQMERSLRMLSESGIGYVVSADSNVSQEYHDATLHFEEAGAWTWRPLGQTYN